MSISDLHQLFLESAGISTDTRKIRSNSIFFALRGPNFDANKFAADALEAGAAYVVIDNPKYVIDHRTILVDNCLIALQQLAHYHRNFLGIPIIALTGSNGKTTTKELIHVVLQEKFNTKATVGNLNNHIGVPLTLLSFDRETEIGIVEMGANHQKEIEQLCRIAEPDFGYITNFGKAHLEGFGGIEGVIKGKTELYKHLAARQKVAFINADDSTQVQKSNSIKTVSFGISNAKADIQFQNLTNEAEVGVMLRDQKIVSKLVGKYNIPNICAAVAIGTYFEIPIENIKSAIAQYTPTNNRSQNIKIGKIEIISDAYNANPSSMEAALKNLSLSKAARKLAILGDMFELGDESPKEHTLLIKLANDLKLPTIFIGPSFSAVKDRFEHQGFYTSFDDFELNFKQDLTDTLILVKGSRAMALERVIPLLEKIQQKVN
ncbi:UDP-N-acetylmuramoyl-tripeptide--D-alanyl-D-alanine ligase [Flavobacterium aurantiibacter]|uniref:UDP-N-acetylmuramoyl-tripeptide--D-alanyl-D-alanine ligase n=1 Tax=Flavobacterium aurantiibacter TaxID=2023067 RepID=A0A255ZSN5_9FLAO|nr:UDP-N-acetylmuramoyl-tripeptide--D-alanyl-D-alanine ligase [Flavobacterium aurantiibacter]OYQ44399.1 UDP-N-acetylmuramoyl-tripeptide--D-alanyl-D-alanine ligase [Flavobacterium aurantiibacter]